MRGRTFVPRRPGRRARPIRPLHAEVLEGRQLLATFTVITVADTGPGSLREAILSANVTPGLDQINFAVPGPASTPIQIVPATPLPAITDAVVIDGTTQAG